MDFESLTCDNQLPICLKIWTLRCICRRFGRQNCIWRQTWFIRFKQQRAVLPGDELLDNVWLRNRAVFTAWHRPVVWSSSKVTRTHANGREHVVRWARAKDHTPCDIQMNATYDRQSRCHKRRFAVSQACLLISVELLRVIFTVYAKQTRVISKVISIGLIVN